MSVLKKMLALTLMFVGVQAGAQNLSEAFAKSYASENTQNYEEAIKPILFNYFVGSYEMNLRLGWLYYLNGKQTESVSYYQKAIALKPGATEPLWGIVYPLSVQEKWAALEQVYKDILKLDPKNAKAHYYLGSIFFYRKDYQTARKYLNEVVALYPFDHDAGLLLGWSNYYLGNQADAKILFNRVLLNQPEDSSAKEGLSLIK